MESFYQTNRVDGGLRSAIVTTRLLYCLQDRLEQLSRMQRIYPHAW